MKKFEAEMKSSEERLTFLEGSAKARRSRGLRVRIGLLAFMVVVLIFLRFREQLGL